MKKLSRGAKLEATLLAASSAGCVLEQGEDRSDLHFTHPKAGSFVLRRKGLRDGDAPFALIRFVNRAIES